LALALYTILPTTCRPILHDSSSPAEIIGTTAHDAIDVMRGRRSMSAPDLERVGADVERIVVARAVDWHLDDRLLVHENRTVTLG
jgi:formyltetrahydrofolate hydrolase